jgi:SAM-dependent methyltransferase
MNEPRGQELIDRYKANYNIPADAVISEDMILKHWDLEKELTRRLLNSKADNRLETFESCYSTLYSELKWLNEYVDKGTSRSAKEREFKKWLELIGPPSTQRIYEVGSGKAELISFIAQHGYPCTATEITRERGKKHSTSNITWKGSDGVHLGRYEQHESFDVVISDQMIEHIHPDDTQEHFCGVYDILEPRGRYIFRVPHRFTGPHDVSRIFKCKKALGMHLRELTFGETRSLAKAAGFTELGVVLIDSGRKIRGLFSKDGLVSTPTYLDIVTLIEQIIRYVPSARIQKRAIRTARRLGLFPGIFVVGRK